MGVLDGGELGGVPHRSYGERKEASRKTRRSPIGASCGYESHEIVGREKERCLFAMLASAATG